MANNESAVKARRSRKRRKTVTWCLPQDPPMTITRWHGTVQDVLPGYKPIVVTILPEEWRALDIRGEEGDTFNMGVLLGKSSV